MLEGSRIALTGATGRLGQAMASALLATGAHVTAIVRTERAMDPRLAAAVAALTDGAALEAALEGYEQLVVILPDAPELPDMMANLVSAAEAVGIKRIIKISAHLAGENPPESFGIEHSAADALTKASAIESIIYRPAMFMQSLSLFLSDWEKGRMLVPVSTGKVALIDAGDIAAAVVKALEGEVPPGTYTLTGPESVSFSEITAALSTWSGKTIKHVAPPLFVAGLAMRFDKTLDGFNRNRLLAFLKALEAGKEAPVLPDLESILGRPGIALKDRLAQCPPSDGKPPQWSSSA
ncbi:MAG: NAD(P)H-binding protein [Pseudomonadota bacterium]